MPDETRIASIPCKALPHSAVESFDPRVAKRQSGGTALCSYIGPEPEGPPSLQLSLELYRAPVKAAEAFAKKICQKDIREISQNPDYKNFETVPALGQESQVATGFIKAKSDLAQDETIYIADWSERESCARLIYVGESHVSMVPLSKFIRLAESVSVSG